MNNYVLSLFFVFQRHSHWNNKYVHLKSRCGSRKTLKSWNILPFMFLFTYQSTRILILGYIGKNKPPPETTYTLLKYPFVSVLRKSRIHTENVQITLFIEISRS